MTSNPSGEYNDSSVLPTVPMLAVADKSAFDFSCILVKSLCACFAVTAVKYGGLF